MTARGYLLYAGMALLIVLTGMFQGWNLALTILNMGLISAIMSLGVNLQWGFAGLFNVGVMGFVALGGLAAVLVSQPPVAEGWNAGGLRLLGALALGAAVLVAAVHIWKRKIGGRMRTLVMLALLIGGFFLLRAALDPELQSVLDDRPLVRQSHLVDRRPSERPVAAAHVRRAGADGATAGRA